MSYLRYVCLFAYSGVKRIIYYHYLVLTTSCNIYLHMMFPYVHEFG